MHDFQKQIIKQYIDQIWLECLKRLFKWHISLYQTMCHKSSEVSRVSWWMAHYKSPTPKRHYAYANSEKVLQLDKGPLRAVDRKAKKDRIKTADHYFNKQGKKCYKGTKHLRSTETLE